MIITTKTTISFKMPGEFEKAREFGEKNPDWKREDTTLWVTFSKGETYSVKGGE